VREFKVSSKDFWERIFWGGCLCAREEKTRGQYLYPTGNIAVTS
jgi:hypothetical protein